MSEPIYCEGDCQEVLTDHGRRVELCNTHAMLWRELQQMSLQLATVTGKLERLQQFVDSSQWHKENEQLRQQLAEVTLRREETVAMCEQLQQERDAGPLDPPEES